MGMIMIRREANIIINLTEYEFWLIHAKILPVYENNLTQVIKTFISSTTSIITRSYFVTLIKLVMRVIFSLSEIH